MQPDWNGTSSVTLSFTFDGQTVTRTLPVLVRPVNDAPRDPQGNDAALALTMPEETALDISIASLLADDTQPGDEDQATVRSGVSGAVGGTVTVDSSAGLVRFTPNAGFKGAGGFFYRAADILGAVGEQVWVPVTVNPVNDGPREPEGNDATPGLTTVEDTPLTINVADLLSDDIQPADAPQGVAFFNVFDWTYGSVINNGNGTVTFTPSTDCSGVAGFFYRAEHSEFTPGDFVFVPVTVTPQNDAPRDPQGNDAALGLTTAEDTPLTISIAALLGDDTQPADENQTVTLNSVSNWGGGTVVDNGDGTLTFTPDANFNGTANFYYRAQDSQGAVGDVVWVPVTVTPVNDAPVAVADTFTMRAGQVLSISAPGLLANDTDADNDPLTAARFFEPTNGTLLLVGNGSFTYTPNAGFVGTDSFSYQVFDGVSDSNFATVTIDVTAPSAGPQFAITAQSATSVLEGTAPGAGGSVTFTITRTGALDAADVIYSVSGTGANPVDLADMLPGLGSSSVVFAEGEMVKTFTILANPDPLVEANEGVRVALTSASFGTVDTTPREVTILNDDAQADLSRAVVRTDGKGAIVEGGTGTFLVTVTNSGPDATGGTVRFFQPGLGGVVEGVTLPGSVTAAHDPATQLWTFPSVASGQSVAAEVTVRFTGAGATNFIAESATADVADPDSTPGNRLTEPTLEDDTAVTNVTATPPPPSVFTMTTFTGINALVREGFSATFPVGVTVNRTGDLSQQATVTYGDEGGLTGISASTADLLAGFGDFTLSFAAGQTQALGLIFLTNDLMRETDETFRVSLVSSTVGTVGPEVNEFTIQDDDSSGPPLPGPGSLCFSGASPGSGRELWAFDPAQGTPQTGTPIARPVDFAEARFGPGGSNPLEITQIDEMVFWRAENEFGFNWYALAPHPGWAGSSLPSWERTPLTLRRQSKTALFPL